MTESDFERARGTAWRIWDLHVHTPASVEQQYGPDDEATWARFLDELEALPEDIGVIGINDYWFLDGYRRVLEARNSGRLTNLDAIFPVIEMRLDHFGGTDGDLARVNLHVVFDPEITADLIQAQFINALQPKLKLRPAASGSGWQGVITKESLTDLGRKIKEAVPASELPNYDSDFREGFNNLNVSLEDVQDVLGRPYFVGKALIGIGKTEWRAIKWNNQSIATKKNVINSADFVFTAYQDVARWEEDVRDLRASSVTHQLLDCSDSHHFADSSHYMRLGACQTWLNTAPTIAGLRYAIEEFDRRVYVGLEPPALARVRKNPERFISQVVVGSPDGDHQLFDYSLPLNSGFVAVVGNKGQGKSALLDCIALGGNSSRNSEFAFLNASRFLSAPNQKHAREYVAELTWATGSSRRARLDEPHDGSVPVSVEYLPQAFVERVCSTDPTTGDADEFEEELRTVLFTHIGEDERSGEKTFNALLTQKTRASQADIARQRDEMRLAIDRYAAAAAFRADNQESEARGRLQLKEAEVEAAKQALQSARTALAEIDLTSKDDAALVALARRSDEIEDARSVLTAMRTENEQRQAALRKAITEMEAVARRADALRTDVAALNAEAQDLLGDQSTPFLTLTVSSARYEKWKSSCENTLATLKTEQETILKEMATSDEHRQENADALAAADGARERARQRVLQSQERVAALVGNANDADSLTGLKLLIERITAAPAEMDTLRVGLVEGSGRIYQALRAQLSAVESLYEPASDFIAQSEVVKNAGLEFNAELRILPSWRSVSAGLDGRRNGDFLDWLAELPQRLEDTSWEQIAGQLTEALIRLESERGEPDGDFRNPANALRSATTLDGFLADMLDLSWLEVRFGLTGDGQPLSQLSPGQRGLVLALFYLVVDRRTTPLLLDQPEENLDNETIASKLVPAIHEAVGRRQTVVVTHNANLAVVGDADQIVHCQMRDNQFTVNSGSIAELDVAQFALNVLEGTKPAFDNRQHKYAAFPELK